MKVVRTYRFCQKGGELMRKLLAVMFASLLIVFSCTGCLFAPDPSWGLETQTEETAWLRKGGDEDETIFSTLPLYSSGSIFLCSLLLYAVWFYWASSRPICWAGGRKLIWYARSKPWLGEYRNAGMNNWIRWGTAPFAGAVFFMCQRNLVL